MESKSESVIIGRNAVIEALRAGVSIDKVFLAKGEVDGALKHIASAAREAGAAVVEADRRKLDSLCMATDGEGEHPEKGERVHQGVVAMAAYAEYSSIDDILGDAKEKGQEPLVVVCDEITDPHNLGAIIRTCEAVGAHGVVIPKRRSAGLTHTVAKASSGAVFHMRIARVPNITATLRELKKRGVWIFGASTEKSGTALWETDFSKSAALVIGSEGKGIGRLVGENCDHLVNIPMEGRLSSLNASVSAAILLYEAFRQRR